ncbi:MAG: hypothetical protein IPG38_00430 [Chitinophagaceae bacterium]|nr:hypothetical protein [Chitinophagaceae bacterium]
MKTNYSGILFFMILTGFFLTSCQKELDGLINGGVITPVNQKPKVGTTWYYRYYVYFPNGNLYTKIVTHKAKSEETINGEKWLKIVDVATDTLAYLLNEKPGAVPIYQQ